MCCWLQMTVISFKKGKRDGGISFIAGLWIIGHFQQLTQKYPIFQLDKNLIYTFSKTTGYSAPRGY